MTIEKVFSWPYKKSSWPYKKASWPYKKSNRPWKYVGNIDWFGAPYICPQLIKKNENKPPSLEQKQATIQLFDVIESSTRLTDGKKRFLQAWSRRRQMLVFPITHLTLYMKYGLNGVHWHQPLNQCVSMNWFPKKQSDIQQENSFVIPQHFQHL